MVSVMRIEFHPEATAELEASTVWYAERSRSAAQAFLVAVDLAIIAVAHGKRRPGYWRDR